MSEQASETEMTIRADDPASLARGLVVMNENIVAIGQAVATLTTLLGIAVALKDGASDPQLTLTESLFKALDVAERQGQFSAAITQNLRIALQAGCNASPPPNGGTRLRIVQGEKKAA